MKIFVRISSATVRQGTVRQGTVKHTSMAWHRTTGLGTVWHVKVWHGTMRHDMARYRTVLTLARLNSAYRKVLWPVPLGNEVLLAGDDDTRAGRAP